MQPTLRQVPPKVPRLSMQALESPNCPARIAALYPPGPPPMTTTSKVSLIILHSSPGRQQYDGDVLKPPSYSMKNGFGGISLFRRLLSSPRDAFERFVQPVRLRKQILLVPRGMGFPVAPPEQQHPCSHRPQDQRP